MATVCAVLATTHHPFYYKATHVTPPEKRHPQADEWRRKVEAYEATLEAAKPDVLVIVGADHFHQFFYDNYPAFLVGKQPKYDAVYHNEERLFQMPTYVLDGQEELSAHLIRGLMDRGFDLSVSHELKLDHGIVCPIITTRPAGDLPVVPILTNIFAPPLPSTRRFFDLGCAIRSAVEDWPSDLRVAIIGSGHLSLELGGPRGFQETAPDLEFDRKAIQWFTDGNVDSVVNEVTYETLLQSGNATAGFLDLVLMLGVAGPYPADYADSLELFHTTEAYFTWYPQGGEL
jgi:protocatechuate 4,5-dioxygenase beta chain